MGVINPFEQRPPHMPLILPYAVDLAPSAARISSLEVPAPIEEKREYIVEPLYYNESLDVKTHIRGKKYMSANTINVHQSKA